MSDYVGQFGKPFYGPHALMLKGGSLFVLPRHMKGDVHCTGSHTESRCDVRFQRVADHAELGWGYVEFVTETAVALRCLVSGVLSETMLTTSKYLFSPDR